MGEQTYVLRVVDWDRNYENNRTRELKRIDWFPVPNKQDGDGYTELMDHPEGASHYGCWIAILAVASKCSNRGVLMRDAERPHDAASLSRITRIPTKLIAAAIDRLVAMKWLERNGIQDNGMRQIPQEGAGKSHPSAGKSQDDAGIPHPGAGECLWNGMEWNGREGNGIEEKFCSDSPDAASREPDLAVIPVSLPIMVFPCVGKGPTEWPLGSEKLAEYREAYPGVEPLEEARKALQWCLDNPTKRKTYGGMSRFLNLWMSRAQDRAGSRVTVGARSPPDNLFRGLLESRAAELGDDTG